MQTENMGSRRLMNRSLSGDGRYYYSGNDITSQNSTGGCRSYLNSVRPERRSTLCSVMAQLAEETQPTFESTLKSKAVSEATNVKFICMVSGHPAPDVTWYKDDVQLDRYCGLPKYEILRDGKTHRLNIYNCTLEDAAIYQASAQNSRGIVSCSGVLEVGTMNEYKIHQNYFAKLKQGNENCRREQKEPRKAEKDNVPSSPDRTQRKRSSPMETTTSFGASSSSEEKEELNALSKTSAVEDSLSSPVQVPESTPVHFPSDSEMIPNVDKGNQGLTYIHDTMHTASIKQADSYAKKKIKKREEMKETEMRNEKKTSVEKMEVQNIQNNVDITANTKQNEKSSMKASKGATDVKKTQVAHKPITSQRHPALKVTMDTETKVVKETKQIKSPDNQKYLDRRSPLIKPHSKLQSQNIKHVQNQRVQNGTPSSPDNKLMDLDDSKSKLAAGPCVRILPHSCGRGDVNTDTGDRNVSVHSSRASAGGDSRIEPTETKNGNIPSSARYVAMKLNEPPSLMHDVTSRFTDTLPLLGSHHLATQGQKEIAEDQSMVLTNNCTQRHKPDLESTQLGEKNSTNHVSNSLQDGQVTIAMNSSMEEDTLTKISEKDYTDGNLMINRASDKPETKIKSVATSLNGTEVNKMGINADKKKVCITANVQGQKSISKEKSMGSKRSVSLVTDFVQIHSHSNMSNPDVAQSQIMNESSNFKALMKHTKALEFQKDSHVATENVSKMEIQEQGQSYTAKNETQQSFISKASTIDNDSEAAHIDSLPFLSQQHPKTFLSNLIIPAIYVTDVDCTTPNTWKNMENMECSSPVRKSENVKFGAKPNVLNNNNAVSQKVNTSDHTDNITPESVGLPDEQVDLSLHPQSSAGLNQPQQKALSQENFIKTSGSQRSTESIASDFTGPVGRCIQLSNADKSKKANESDLAETKCPVLLAKTDSNLKPESNYFIKQLKSAALDLELSNQRSTSVTLHDLPHRESEGKDKYRQTNSEVKQGESVLLQGRNNLNTVVCPLSPSSDLTIPLKTTDAQIITSSEPHKTEKRDVGKSNQKETYQEQILPLMPQPASPLNLDNDAPSLEKNSPRLMRRAIADHTEINGNENVTTKSSDRDKENQFIVPQVIRKIRPEVFDTSGHLKLWCQFYNIVSDSTIRWFKDDVEIAEIKRSAGDETQVCLAIIQMSKRDCGVYRCSITNENGQNSTEYLLSTETVSSMFLRQELQEVEEEIEMTPLIFSKGLADAGCWGSKFYGRVTTEEVQVGSGCKHKTRRLRVIYGLDPVFESRSSCLLKVRSPIAYESREETVLAEKNLQITKQDCRIQNMAREYVKIFATETREIESFGSTLEIIPLYFMYRPASSVPYGTVEAELKGVFLRYCRLDHTGSLVYNNKSEVAQKCSSFQHWIHQWTSGNVLFSRLEGVDTILTNIEVVTKSKGHQGFPCEANPKVFERFPTEHQCNYFCGLLNLKPPKLPEMLQTVRYRGYYSPQTQRKAPKSPKVSRKSNPQTSI